jgi:hypothetical protein
MGNVNGRFFTEEIEEGWQAVDGKHGMTLAARNKTDAENTCRFARAYVRIHGDIDFSRMPYSVDQPFVPEDIEED